MPEESRILLESAQPFSLEWQKTPPAKERGSRAEWFGVEHSRVCEGAFVLSSLVEQAMTTPWGDLQ